MNRAERRRAGIKGKEPVYNLNLSQIEKIKQDATIAAINRAYFLMVSISVSVIHDKFGQLMKRAGREELFADLIIQRYKDYQDGYYTLDDLEQCLYEETGIRMVNKDDRRNKNFND